MYINPPFNYTGSKYKLLDQIIPLFKISHTFVDLFAGGGSVWVNIVDRYSNVIVNDVLRDLIRLQEQLIMNPVTIIKETLAIIPNKDNKEDYLKLRDSYNENKSSAKLWALMLTCTNNMMRFNKSFEFNQTWGNRGWNENIKNKVLVYVKSLQLYKNLINFYYGSFDGFYIPSGSMIYMDPPYMETEAGYNAFWSYELDRKLYEYILNNENNYHIAISGVLGPHKNGKRSKLIDGLITYGFQIHEIKCNYEKVARIKNSKDSQEVLLTNY